MRISGSNAGYTMFRGSVKSTGYPLHWQFPIHFSSRASPCAITFQMQSTSIGQRISGSNAGYTMFRGSVKSTGYPLHSQFPLQFSSRASPCAITFQTQSTSIGQCISGSDAGYTMFRGSVKSTDYLLILQVHLHFLPVRHRVPSHFNWPLPTPY